MNEKKLRLYITFDSEHVETKVIRFADGYNRDIVGRFGSLYPHELFMLTDIYKYEEVMNVPILFERAGDTDERPGIKDYIPGLIGWFHIQMEMGESGSPFDFDLEEARYYDPKKGGKNVKAAISHPTYGKLILQNMFKALANCDGDKLNVILQNLIKT